MQPVMWQWQEDKARVWFQKERERRQLLMLKLTSQKKNVPIALWLTLHKPCTYQTLLLNSQASSATSPPWTFILLVLLMPQRLPQDRILTSIIKARGSYHLVFVICIALTSFFCSIRPSVEERKLCGISAVEGTQLELYRSIGWRAPC